MSIKIKTLTLTFPHFMLDRGGEQMYKVAQVIDSVDPTVSTFLPKKDVQDFCAAKDWKVIVKPNVVK